MKILATLAIAISLCATTWAGDVYNSGLKADPEPSPTPTESAGAQTGAASTESTSLNEVAGLFVVWLLTGQPTLVP